MDVKPQSSSGGNSRRVGGKRGVPTRRVCRTSLIAPYMNESSLPSGVQVWQKTSEQLKLRQWVYGLLLFLV